MLIGELAKLAGMTKDGIRHYEELNLISSAPRQAGSRIYRDYDVALLDTIDKIHTAQRLGFSLKEIGPLLKVYGAKMPSDAEMIELLEGRLILVREKLTALREVEDFICRKLAQHQKGRRPRSQPGPVTEPDIACQPPGKSRQAKQR
ncbi:MAG TPA: MerR family transcriptional regulator [Terriglobales bacterium]|nr:MerR family transcriptional regulator [Terriglobales bacterium]